MPKSGTVLSGFSRFGAMRSMIAVCWLVVQSSGMMSPTEKLSTGVRPNGSLQVGCSKVQVLVGVKAAPQVAPTGSAAQGPPGSQGVRLAVSVFGSSWKLAGAATL